MHVRKPQKDFEQRDEKIQCIFLKDYCGFCLVVRLRRGDVKAKRLMQGAILVLVRDDGGLE